MTQHQLVCVVILVCLVCEGALESSKDEKRLNKRFNELDFPTCLENFDIHTDTIIRAQDSRAIGGRYINETEVASREECLRLCCQTSLCDVFIFEEKSPGSCYLFDCGSSDDFKCKFNPHHHYTSGVMAVNRHVAELESQGRLSKHEEELTGLRKSAVVVHTTVPVASPTTTTTTTSIGPSTPARPAAPAALPLIVATLSTSIGHSKCSRYQFECRASGDCIAIYNACDGIPQCSDGSDEGPELACPSLPVPSTQPPPSPSQVVPKPAGQPEGPAQFPQFRQPPVWPASPSWQQQPPKPAPEFNGQQNQAQAQQMQQQYSPQQQQQQQQGATEAGHKFYGRDGVDYGGAQWPAAQYRAPGVNNPAGQPFHRPATYPAPEYQDPQNSHIFNHKGGSVLSSEVEGSAQYGGYAGEAKQPAASGPEYYPSYRQPPQAQWPPRPRLQQPQDHAPESVLGHSVEEELRAHAAHFGPAPQSPDYYSYEEGGATLHRHVHPPQPPPVKQEQPQVKAQHRPPALMEGQIESVVTVETPRQITDPQPTAAPNPQPKETTTEHPLEVAHSKFHYSGESSKKKSLSSHPPPPIEPEPLQLPDGAAATPGGAYLSLSVGLAVTALLVVLISCRLRVVRRRLRRGGGKSPYAHDADFLVNGMYL